MFEDFDMGVNGEEAAQPQSENTDLGGGSADDTANQEGGTLNAAGENEENVAGSSEGTANTQSREDNARYAAARRESEGRLKQMENRMAALAKSQGFNSFDELEHHLKEDKLNALGRKLYEEYGVDQDAVKPFIDDMVNAHPDVVMAREALELSRQQEAQRYVDSEIAKIKEINPDIKSFEDLLKMENFSDVEELLKRNYTISDAYKVANFGSIMEGSGKKVAQQVRNDIDSKNHLSPTKGAAAGDTVMVPEDIKEQYRVFNPGITDEEILKDYKKSLERK